MSSMASRASVSNGGRTTVVTKVENPTKESAALEVHVNGVRAGDAAQIPAGATLNVERAIPAGREAVAVG